VLEGLTEAECRVVDLVARGWKNREIAEELRLRPKTVEWTLTKVYRKLGVRSRTELALEATRSSSGAAGFVPSMAATGVDRDGRRPSRRTGKDGSEHYAC
jgi:DNA-binding CsgD family transcriptional regulator